MVKIKKKQRELCDLLESKNYYWVKIMFMHGEPYPLEVEIWDGEQAEHLCGKSYKELISLANDLEVNTKNNDKLKASRLSYEQKGFQNELRLFD